jgi:hypothetical protein
MSAERAHRRSMRARALLAASPLVVSILACGLAGEESDQPPPPSPQPPSVVAPPPLAPAPPPGAAPIVNREAAGNLAATRPALGCIEATQIESSMNPADLYAAMEACARADRPQDALLLFGLAGVYGRFDTLRVADRSAHGGVQIIHRRHVDAVPAEQWTPVQERLRQTTGDPAELARFCGRVRAVGHPTYHPAYMIQHGMGAFLGQGGDPLVPGFDPTAGWESALDSYLHCPPARAQ